MAEGRGLEPHSVSRNDLDIKQSPAPAGFTLQPREQYSKFLTSWYLLFQGSRLYNPFMLENKDFDVKVTPLGLEYACSDPCKNCRVAEKIDDAARKILKEMADPNSGFAWNGEYYMLMNIVQGPAEKVISCNPCGARFAVSYGLNRAGDTAGIICETIQHYRHLGFVNTERKQTL